VIRIKWLRITIYSIKMLNSYIYAIYISIFDLFYAVGHVILKVFTPFGEKNTLPPIISHVIHNVSDEGETGAPNDPTQ
jgi:hypothetical protein